MPAAKYDFNIEQGSSFKLSITYKDADGIATPLTDWCARLTWKTNTNITQVFNTTNVDYAIYKFVIDEPNGKLTLQLPAETTNNFLFNAAKYDIELQSPDDLYDGGGKYTKRVLFGTVNIVKRFSQNSAVLDCQND